MVAKKHKAVTLLFLDHILKRFKEEGIKYWLDYGSLLGAVRESGIIPHDYDIDIGVWSKDQKVIRKIILEEESGFAFNWQYCDWNGNYNMWNIDSVKLDGQISDIKLDIYYFEKYKKGTMAGPLVYTESEAPYWKDRKGKCFLSKSYYYENLITTDFENRKFPIPKYHDKYLPYLYGEDYIDVKKIRGEDYNDTEMPVGKGHDPTTGYVEGVFDMFHVGHSRMLDHCTKIFDKVVAGVHSDETVFQYKKKKPIIPYEHRVEILKSCKFVDKVIEAPLFTDHIDGVDFLNNNDLDYLVHGKTDQKFLRYHYPTIMDENRLFLLEETKCYHTADLLEKIQVN